MPPSDRVPDFRRALWGWVGLGVLLRAVYAWFVPVVPISDFGWYHARALAIAEGQGYSVNGVPTSFWPVGYPGFLGGLYTVFGPHSTVGVLANLVLAAVTLALIPVVARALGLSGRTQVAAVAIWALWPNQVAYASLLSAEPLAQALLLGAVACALHRRPGWAGLLWGLGALVKPHFILVPVVWGAVSVWVRRRGRDDGLTVAPGFRATLVSLAVAALVLAPWTLRNAQVWGRPVFVSTNGGYNFLIGANRAADGGWMEVRGMVPADSNEARLDRAFLVSGLRSVRQDPIRWLGLMPVKMFRLFSPSNEAIHWAVASIPDLTTSLSREEERQLLGLMKPVASAWGTLVIVGLPVALTVLALRRPRLPILWATASLLGVWLGLHALLFGDPRFLAPLTPWIAMVLPAAVQAMRRPANRV